MITVRTCRPAAEKITLLRKIVQTRGWHWLRLFSAVLTALLLPLSLCAQAQKLVRDGQSMSGVADVTGGAKVFLEDDDIGMLQIKQSGSTVTTSLVSFDSSDSKLSHDPHTASISSFETKGNFDPKAGVIASQAVGRMYNTRSDMVAIVNAIDDGAPHWSFTLYDPLTKFVTTGTMNSSAGVYGTVSTQAVMGDFNGDGLADPLMFYSSVDAVHGTQWGMRILTAADPKKEAAPVEGPEFFSGNADALPLTGSIVVGDFNNDGRDEIAVLRKDLRTIVFYTVDPKALTISEVKTLKLPVTMRTGQVTLAAGRFRSQDPGPTNADLVVFGQINDHANGYSVIPVRITPSQDGTFSPNVVGDSFFRFPDYHGATGALAQAASLVYWPQQIYQQLVLGIRTTDGASFVEIGSFEQDDTLAKFNWESETKRDHDGPSITYLQNIWVGNFDNRGSDSTHSPALQVETYETVFNAFPGNYEPHVMIFDVAVPAPPNPVVTKPGNWLKEKSNNTSAIPLVSDPGQDPSMNVVVPGDFQGRSLRLGAPTIVRIKSQIQPDLVLAVPPMHADWIAPNTDTSLLDQPGCTDAGTPCVMNLSVLPSLPPSSQPNAFTTKFVFASSANNSTKRSSTTSWGISVKQTAETKATFGDGLTEGNLDIKNTAEYAHDSTVKKTFSTYKGESDQLSATTGFADHLFFTQRGMNVYYYPVLGCESDGSNCTTDNRKLPLYIEFSVPDEISHSDVDGTTQDWYQPVHEPGNIFSYPWSLAQLENQFGDKVTSLTTKPPNCMATDTSPQTATTQWSQGSSRKSSSGSTNSFSDELSMSYTASAGVEGVDAASFSEGIDIAGSTSLNTLNVSTSSLSSSEGITITKPVFNYPAECCSYAFGQYIFGLKNTKHPASEDACQPGQDPEKDHCIALNDPEGNAINIASTGPLFTGYIVNPLDGNNSDLTCAGNSSWWQSVYTKPDVALNHPERWYWDIGKQRVFFNAADHSGKIQPQDQPFYAMKGFFITQKNAPGGPNLAQATAGDQLTLKARVYNYSLADTTGLVHVRFYGQRYCSSGGTEASCKNGNASCNAGTLCGDSFLIGESQIQAISGFKADGGNDPNWKLTSVDFDTSNYARSNLVFWVVAWMEDGSGKLVPEMPGHGLKQNPAASLTQISDVPIEDYSNNVGMYGVHQQFYILPKKTSLGAEPSDGKLQSMALSMDSQAPLGQRTKIAATLQAAGASVNNVNIAYYDGDPAKGGILLDVQKIANIESGERYYHRAFFVPQVCGVHNIYATAWTAGAPDVQASATTTVGASSQEYGQALIDSTQSAKLNDTQLRSKLLDTLNGAMRGFQQGNLPAAQMALSLYVQRLAAAGTTTADQLMGQAHTLLGCTPVGFLLTALPSSAQIKAGDMASYDLAITPTGGFQGPVSVACSGLPRGASCSVSTQTVNLDGRSQSRLTVQVSTTDRTMTAGVGRGAGVYRRRWEWTLILLLNVLSIVILQQGRRKGNSLRLFLLFLVVSGIIGCGGSGSSGSTPAGRYAVTVQATSGSTTHSTELALIVN